jgi:hypothetical protein
MANEFPTLSGSVHDDLSVAWTKARVAAGYIKQQTLSLKALSVAGNVGSTQILDYLTMLTLQKASLQNSAAIPGIDVYAQNQTGTSIDITVSFNAMVSAINTVGSWIMTNFPKDASGFLLAKQWEAGNTGRTVDRQFTTSDLAAFRTQLDALLATLN